MHSQIDLLQKPVEIQRRMQTKAALTGSALNHQRKTRLFQTARKSTQPELMSRDEIKEIMRDKTQHEGRNSAGSPRLMSASTHLTRNGAYWTPVHMASLS